MIIVRGINVFPRQQIESVLMKIPEVGNHFGWIIGRQDWAPLDSNGKVQIEMHESAFSG